MLAWLFRKPVIHVECSAQVATPSLFGRILSPFAALTIVQWPGLVQQYGGRAVYAPLLFDRIFASEAPVDSQARTVFCTVGTTREDFSRLLVAMDDWARRHADWNVLIQRGHSRFTPSHADSVDFMDMDAFRAAIRTSCLVVTHGGVGCISNALDLAKPTVVVPRLAKFREHENDHQLEIARELGRSGLVHVVHNTSHLDRAIEKALSSGPPRSRPTAVTSAPRAVEVVARFLDAIQAQEPGASGRQPQSLSGGRR